MKNRYKLLIGIWALIPLLVTLAYAQTFTVQTRELFERYKAGVPGAGFEAGSILDRGPYVKTIDADGNVTSVDANNAPQTLALDIGVETDATLKGDATADDPLGLTIEEVNQLSEVDGLVSKTADLSVEVVSTTWANVTALANGGFVSHNNADNLSVSQAAGLTYILTKTANLTDANRNGVVIRVPNTEDFRDFRIKQTFAPNSYYIHTWNRIGTTGGFKYAYSHTNLYDNYVVHIQHRTIETTTHFRGEADADKVEVDATGFSGNLSGTDTDAQTAFETLNALPLGTGGDDAATWAEQGNTDNIPVAKFGTNHIPGTALQNLGVTNGKLAANVAEKLCPDPSTGTSGQVCARNAAGVYVLVDQGGGSGGTPTQAQVYTQAKEILQAGANVTITEDDTNNELTIAATGTGGGGTAVTANPGTADANDDVTSLGIASVNYNVADEVARIEIDAVEDLLGFSGRQELHPRPPLPVEELTGNHNHRVRALGYADGLLYGFRSNASGGSVNGTDLLNSRNPQNGGTVAYTPETTPVLLFFFLDGTTLYGQNLDGNSETSFTTTTIRAGVPYALSNYPDENGKLYMLIDSGNNVYVEELNYNAGGTVTHAETVATITPAILNRYAASGGYEDETDTASDTGSNGGDAAGITDLYVAGDFAWFLVTYAEDSGVNVDHNYIARFARTDSAFTAPATVGDDDLVQTGIRSNANHNSLVALATEAGLLTDLFLSRASNPFLDHFTNSRLGDYEDLANRPG